MPEFNFKAKNLAGKKISGIRNAKNKKELIKDLSKDGYVLVSLKEEFEEERKKSKGIVLFERKKVSLNDKMLFTQHLSVMVDSGFSFSQSLSVLANQAQNKYFKTIIFEIKNDITKGKSFSDSLEKHPKVFNELYSNMVRVGEETGNLKETLELLARQMEKDHQIISKVRGAMIYPAVIMCLMVVIGIAMMITVIPKFSEMFESMDKELPPTTKFIMIIGDIVANYWHFLPIIVFVFIISIRQIKKTEKGKRNIDWLNLNLPIIGSFIKGLNVARIARTFSSLLKSGVPIVRTLEIISGTLTNSYYKDTIFSFSKTIQKGETLYESVKPYEKLYSFMFIQMIKIGEDTGKLGEIFEKMAKFFEEEVNNKTANLSSVVEPALMIVIGGAVGFFAISILQPMYGMMGGV